ncbi:hypothetical protein ACX8XO_15235 [Calditrichota bacterium LG24]
MIGQLVDFKVPKGRNDYSPPFQRRVVRSGRLAGETVSTVYANNQKGEHPSLIGAFFSFAIHFSRARNSEHYWKKLFSGHVPLSQTLFWERGNEGEGYPGK